MSISLERHLPRCLDLSVGQCLELSINCLVFRVDLLVVLQLVLAMGNRLNQGNPRVEQASAFRVNYLAMVSTVV